MAFSGQARAVLAAGAVGQGDGAPRKRSARKGPAGWERWLSEPRSLVLFVLGAVLLLGGGRKVLHAWRAREAVGRLEDPGVSPETIAAVAEHGRAGLMELFRLLAEGQN